MCGLDGQKLIPAIGAFEMLRTRVTRALWPARRSFASAANSTAGSAPHAWEPIEAKWQQRWAAQAASTPAPVLPDAADRKSFYCLAMFPYPSGTFSMATLGLLLLLWLTVCGVVLQDNCTLDTCVCTPSATASRA